MIAPTRTLTRLWLAALVLCMLPGYAFAQTIVHLTTAGAGTGADLCTEAFEHNEACFEQGDGNVSAGTGLFDPFYQVKDANMTEVEGVNTAGRPTQFQTVGSGKGEATELLLSTVTQVEVNGTLYRELFLDINQTSGNAIYDILEIQMYTDDQPDLTCLDPATQSWGSCDTGTPANLI